MPNGKGIWANNFNHYYIGHVNGGLVPLVNWDEWQNSIVKISVQTKDISLSTPETWHHSGHNSEEVYSVPISITDSISFDKIRSITIKCNRLGISGSQVNNSGSSVTVNCKPTFAFPATVQDGGTNTVSAASITTEASPHDFNTSENTNFNAFGFWNYPYIYTWNDIHAHYQSQSSIPQAALQLVGYYHQPWNIYGVLTVTANITIYITYIA